MAAKRLLFDPRLPFAVLAGLAVVLVLTVVAMRLLGIEGTLRYTDLWRAEQPLPGTAASATAREPAAAPPPAGPPPVRGEPVAGAPPVEPPETLLEPGAYGALPRRGEDGRSPFSVYRSNFAFDPERPRIALVVVGLGLAREPTLTATELPPLFGLGFSPYGRELAGWMRYGRWRGHEVLLELPVRPARYPLDDAGPLALAPDLPPERLEQRLETTLAAGKGYFAVTVEAGAYVAAPETFAPVLARLAEAGLGLIELGGDHLAAAAARQGVPYLWSDPPIDLDPAPEAIDLALGRLETRALREGAALGTLEGAAVTYARLRQWLPSLEAKGLQLVAPSRVFDGLARGPAE